MERSGIKRKRSGSLSLASSQPPSRLPSGSINPLSHTPSTLSQFLIAGLTDSEQVPSKVLSHFPHRPWRDPRAVRKSKVRRQDSPGASGAESDANTSGDDAASTDGEIGTDAESVSSNLPKNKSYAAERAALRPLAQSVAVFLSRDNIPAAKRAFGILMRSKISGKPVDIRRNHYWELGAEILMRERPPGEEPGNDRPAYPFANVHKVTEYFEDLIRNYPYHKSAKMAASAMQFHPALLSYEIYQAHAQYISGIKAAESESGSHMPEFDDPIDGMGFYGQEGLETEGQGYDLEDDNPDPSQGRGRLDSPFTTRESRSLRAKDTARTQTLFRMREMMNRIDRLFEDPSFARSGELLRLAGILSLYISDLAVPLDTLDTTQRDGARMMKRREQEKARRFFERAIDRGADVPDQVIAALGLEALPSAFSSLPFRDHR